jgi:hypothetical protein
MSSMLAIVFVARRGILAHVRGVCITRGLECFEACYIVCHCMPNLAESPQQSSGSGLCRCEKARETHVIALLANEQEAQTRCVFSMIP